MEQKQKNWFTNVITPDLNQQFIFKESLFAGRTKFQSVEILDTPTFGRCLILDGKIQSSESDEFIYHEALVHPSLILHPCPRRVFIAGGGEGAVLREVLAHNTVEEVTMVDIDEDVVKISQKFLPTWHQGSFQDNRVKLFFTDARRCLAKSKEKFDVIICDLSDPISEGPSRLLFTKEFYQVVRNRLTEDGIASIQAESPSLPYSLPFLAIVKTLQVVFPVVAPYYTEVPSFGSTWGFALAFQDQNMDPLKMPPQEIDHRISIRVNRELCFYDGNTHQGLFSLPKYLRQKMEAENRVITDNEPLAVW